MENLKPLNQEIVKEHVDHLKGLKNQGKLVLCGPFTDYPGGMVVFLAKDLIEAKEIAESDPFIASGYKTYALRTLEEANEGNNYLMNQ
jgi:uncharacterized protein YciI